MPPELDAFDREWKRGDRKEAIHLARAYVREHHSALAPHLEPCSVEELVHMVDLYRDAGRETDRIIVDMWLLAYYDRREIWGDLTVGGLLEAASEALSRGPA